MPNPAADSDISVLLFNASTVMVGVCLTVIGILYLSSEQRSVVTIGDFLITGVSILFLLAGITSYICLRNRQKQRNYKLERISEVIFCAAMILTVLICLMLEFVLF